MQIWWETKPHRLLLRPATSITWTSTPFTTNDKALMDITTTVYDKCSSQIIKKCWILLQGFFLVDLLFFYQQTVHLAYDEGEAPPSCISMILWPPIPRPPKHYWKLWVHFLKMHITPLILISPIRWESVSSC